MDRFKLSMITLAFLFLAVVGFTKLSLPISARDFSPGNYYEGVKYDSDNDPKKYYQLLNGVSYSDNEDDGCKPEVVYSTNKTNIAQGSYYPIDILLDESGVLASKSTIGVDGSGIFKDGDKLIIPKEGTTFKNSNVTMSKGSTGTDLINIEMYMGSDIVIKFYDVKSWWCHAHNPSSLSHTVTVGNSSSSSAKSAGSGAIVGVAKSTTKIQVWELDEASKASDKTNKTKGATFVKINAGDYLVDGVSTIVK